MSEEYYAKLKKFVEEVDPAVRAAASLKNGAEVGIMIVGFEQKYHFVRENKRSYLRVGPPSKPDLGMAIPPKIIDELVESGSDDIGFYGVKILESIGSDDPERKIHFKVHAGFLTLTTRGYFGMLKLGGKVLGQFLRKYELHKPSNIKKLLQKARG